jgi:hypothetical protein
MLGDVWAIIVAFMVLNRMESHTQSPKDEFDDQLNLLASCVESSHVFLDIID